MKLTWYWLIIGTLKFLDFQLHYICAFVLKCDLGGTHGWLNRWTINITAGFLSAMLAALAACDIWADIPNLFTFLWFIQQSLCHSHAMNGWLLATLHILVVWWPGTLLWWFNNNNVIIIFILNSILLFVSYTINVILHPGSLLLAANNLANLLVCWLIVKYRRRLIRIINLNSL